MILDPSHPREKPCGGGVTGRALALVGSVLDASPIPAARIRSARFVDTSTGRSAAVPLIGEQNDALVVVSRTRFDAHLLEAARAAGATFVSSRVARIDREAGGFTLICADRRAFKAQRIVGADGANSVVRRQFAHAFARAQLSIATGFFVPGTTGDEVVIEFAANPPGYLWSFPRPDHLAVGICAQADAALTAAQLRARVAAWLGAAGLARGASLVSYSWPIPSLLEHDFAALEPAGAGWLLVGDAAGLVDPITREGIFFALQSATFAAEALLDTRAPERYRDRVRAEIGDELARAARVKAAFFRSRFTGVLLDALQRSARIRDVMADLIAGTQPYRGLKRRVARSCELRLAFDLLWHRSRSLSA
jgi:flavin-dependent dehydrogenase